MTSVAEVAASSTEQAPQPAGSPAQARSATRRLGLPAAGVLAGGALVVFLAAHGVPRPGPTPEQAWNVFAATCTSPAAYAYRGVAPSVRVTEPDHYLISVALRAPDAAVTVGYERRRGFANAVDTLTPATRADRVLLTDLGCAPRLLWTNFPPA